VILSSTISTPKSARSSKTHVWHARPSFLISLQDGLYLHQSSEILGFVMSVPSEAKRSLNAFWLLLFFSVLTVRTLAQGPGQMPTQMQQMYGARELSPTDNYETAPNTAVVVLHVFADEKPAHLDRSARMDLTNVANRLGVFLIVPSHEAGVFTDTALGKYDVTVTAVGYLTKHQEISVLQPVTYRIDIVLQRDPNAVTLNEVSGLMPGKAKKEAHRAVSLLKSGQLTKAQKHLDAAYKSSPSNAGLNFLLGYLHFQQNDYAEAGTYLAKAASLSPHSAPTLLLLGRMNLVQKNYPAAQSALEQAVLVDAEQWQAHNLLADAYLNEKEYSKARDEAQIAVAKGARYGNEASGTAELVLGEALLGLGKNEEGIKALQAFVKQSPRNPMVQPVRSLITKLKQGDSNSAEGSSTGAEIDASSADPLRALPKPVLSIQTWRPPDVDDAKPTLVSGVTCPAAQVLAESGEKVQELVQDVTRFAADEELFHQSFDSAGLSKHAETRKYEYAAAVSSQPGTVFIQEYRTDKVGQAGDPDAIAGTGFFMLALVFHPEMQGDFDFDCEGQGEWRGEATWLVHFRQRYDRPNHMHSYSIGDKVLRVDLKGRAWISTASFQILRIEADMINPMHEIQLLSEHQTVEYGPVPFAKKNTTLWLPKDADIYFDFRKHHYYRHHSFDHYMLFGVDTQQKDKVPPSTASTDPN
jgi:tetratricopeptide (TPR) repeat protein